MRSHNPDSDFLLRYQNHVPSLVSLAFWVFPQFAYPHGARAMEAGDTE
jgi:hypothetical protein